MEDNSVEKLRLETAVDQYFPMRVNGKPSYRTYQRETILKILNAFIIGEKKFVAVDGPVGCGKSVINYTVAKVLGDCIYITPFKMLQDQIMDEKWPDVRMLKGKSAYQCNYLLDKYLSGDVKNGSDRIRCNYSEDDFNMCNNSKAIIDYNENTINDMSYNVDKTVSICGDNAFLLRMRTAFKSSDELLSMVDKMTAHCIKRKNEMYDRMDVPEEKRKYKFELEKKITCVMNSKLECPHKTNKLLMDMADIKVLNPDLLYLLLKQPLFDRMFELLTYDECQQIESVINRIFKIKFPIDTIRRMFGIDISGIHNVEDPKKIIVDTVNCVKDTLGPACASARLLYNLGNICCVRNFDTLMALKSTKTHADALRESRGFLFEMYNKSKEWEFSIIDVINQAIKSKELPKHSPFLPFMAEVKITFDEFCSKYRCDNIYDLDKILIPHAGKYIGKEKIDSEVIEKTKKFYKINSKKGFDDLEPEYFISSDKVISDHISRFGTAVEGFVIRMSDLGEGIDIEKIVFAIDRIEQDSLKACSDSCLAKDIEHTILASKTDKCLEVVPIDVGSLMNKFFYSRFRRVLLSSGTWLFPENTFKLYGINKNNVEFIRIPTTFNISNRKIYVINDKSFMNFSEKDDYGSYLYKTPAGIKNFTSDLVYVLKTLRKHIRTKHNENANIIVHCHTFDIAKKIAQHMPGVNSSYLIHIGGQEAHLTNQYTNHDVFNLNKEELIQNIKDNPNSGLTIISTSISEGVDFKGQLVRAQVILKRPIPYLGDLYVKFHCRGNEDIGVERDPDFLNRVCYTIMTQQYGRIVRSESDWGYTVVLDQSIAMGLKEIGKKGSKYIDGINLNYFWEAIQIKEYKKGFPIFSWGLK